MYRRILVAADPEGLAADAAPTVAALARPGVARALVVLVRHPAQHPFGAGAGEAALEHLFDELRARHLEVHVERRDARTGHIADELAAAASAFDADLIVLGSHHRGDVLGFFAGSVGHALAARTRTPILFVSSGPARPAEDVERLLVAVDGGAASRQAVVAAAALTKPGTEITAIYVDNPAAGVGGYPVYVDPTPSEAEGARALDDALACLRASRVETHARRVYALDGTGVAIARAADELDADLIVLGSRRPRNLDALLLGSVAHDVVAHTRRTVLLAAAADPAPAAPSPCTTADQAR